MNSTQTLYSPVLSPGGKSSGESRFLFLRGSLPGEQTPGVAIVGTRRPVSGRRVSYEFGGQASEAGFAVVSGLALGIDSAAHLGCLEAKGQTVAVLPCGLNHVAPASNRHLAYRIVASGGGLVSEYAPATLPEKFRFIERNRISVSLSQGVIIVESEPRSGTMHTARFALEQGKPLACCIPESGPVSSGCRLLLENHGATPLRNAADLASFLETLSNTKKPNPLSWQGRGAAPAAQVRQGGLRV